MRKYLGALLCLVLAEKPLASAAINLATPSTDDALIASASQDSNYGADGQLAVAAAGLPKGEFRSFVRFDVSGIKSAFDVNLGAGI